MSCDYIIRKGCSIDFTPQHQFGLKVYQHYFDLILLFLDLLWKEKSPKLWIIIQAKHKCQWVKNRYDTCKYYTILARKRNEKIMNQYIFFSLDIVEYWRW